MQHQRITHRSFVSYIDKSRDYYSAQGYKIPYGWAYHNETPFQQLTKKLSESTLSIVTTAFFPKGQEPHGVPESTSKKPYATTSNPIPSKLYTDDVSWDKDATDMDDLGSYFPLKTLYKKNQEGIVGSVSKRFYGIPTDYSQRRTIDDAKTILNWCIEDHVDAVILVPV